MKKRVLSFIVVLLLSTPLLAAAEWTFLGGTNCNLRVPHDAALDFPGGFKATVRFACDLTKIGKSRFANLVTKGDDFNGCWSIMVKAV